MTYIKDEIVKEGKWVFDKEVAEVFTDMVSRSIPDYSSMRNVNTSLVRYFVRAGRVLDLGCSNGEGVNDLIDTMPSTQFVLMDNSKEMLSECEKRFSQYKNVLIRYFNITEPFFEYNADAILCCLTLHFIPVEERLKVLHYIYNNLNDGGVLILTEKIVGNTYETNCFMESQLIRHKASKGYTKLQIESKSNSLKNVLVPLSDEANKQMLLSAGFKKIDTVWSCFNFKTYLCIK